MNPRNVGEIEDATATRTVGNLYAEHHEDVSKD